MKGPFKKLRMKRCTKCKYLFKRGIFFACQKDVYIEPIKIICFNKEIKDKEDKQS